MKKLTMLLGSALLSAAFMPAIAQNEADFSYATSNDLRRWGTEKKETYDIAIKIDNPSLVGSKITGMSVKVNDNAANVSDYSAWISKKLTIETVDGKRVNVPDVCSVNAQPTVGYLTVTFPEPYTITEEGVFVGYTFIVNEADNIDDKNPVIVTPEYHENGFWLHTSRTYRAWKDYSQDLATTGVTSVINVVLEGTFYDNAAGVTTVGTTKCKVGNAARVPVNIVNHGSNRITDLGYEYAIYPKGDRENAVQTGSGSVAPVEAVDATFNAPGLFYVDAQPIDELGAYEMVVTVTHVNGEPNYDKAPTGVGAYDVLVEVPIKRPVMEEWTGTWCGYCTRGWVAMELMREQVPGFIGVAYHQGDPMQLKAGYPNMVDGFPSAYLDREQKIDPYYGTAGQGFGTLADYLAAKNQYTPVAVNVFPQWGDDTKEEIFCNITTTWVEEPAEGTSYSLNVILCADDLHSKDTRWNQVNNYSGLSLAALGGETNLMVIAELPNPINDLHFNDVAIQVSGFKSLDCTVNTEVKNVYKFNIASNALVQNKDNLFVVVEVIQDGGTYGRRIVNGAKATIGEDSSGVSEVLGGKTVKGVEYYDLSGRRVANPTDGMYVKVTRYTDGTAASSKVLLH